MSSVMAYFIFWTMFIHKQECAAIRLDHHNRNTLEYIIQKYMNPLRRLSADLPNHAIEMDIEFHGSVPREVKNNPRRLIQLINPHHPKPIPRTQDEKATKHKTHWVLDCSYTLIQYHGTQIEDSQMNCCHLSAPKWLDRSDFVRLRTRQDNFERSAVPAAPPEVGQAAAPAAAPADPPVVPAPPAPPVVPAPADPPVVPAPAEPPVVPGPAVPPVAPAPAAGTNSETEKKIPVFMEDLKKALEELEKKLITAPGNSTAVTTTPCPGAAVAPQGPNSPVRSIDEIVQLLKKAIHVEYRMPRAGDEKLEWMQIKIPKSVQF